MIPLVNPSPAGNVSTANEIGAEPVAVSVKENGTPCFAVVAEALVTTGGAKTVSVAFALFVDPTRLLMNKL
jgi:hypothetical protein